jgi:DMSO/TMAO reductase YedYZ molybdopterin-dependent catalytic subunit
MKFGKIQNWHGVLALTVSLSLCESNVNAGEASGTVLKISGSVKQRVELTLGDLRAMERVSVKAKNRDGADQEFEGVRLWDLVEKARPFGTKEHKELVNACVIVKAKDGYQAVFALAELAPSIGEKSVVLADRCDGKSLPETDGLLKIVVPDERIHSRWVRQVTDLEVVSLLSKSQKK